MIQSLYLPWPFPRADVVAPPTSVVPRRKSLSGLLQHYDTPGVPPPSARVDPTRRRQATRPIRLWDVWKYGAFVATKATSMAGDVLSHHIWGPRKKSWGIEMTLITSFMRDAGRHSALVDISTIRMLMGLGGLVPLPSDALVTPVTFRVRRRKLRGMLADFDAKESGSRELSGEWVVGKILWQRLQAEWKAARAARERSDTSAKQPKQLKQRERVILYLHGGAYYTSSAAAQRLISIPLSKYTDTRVFALDYRLAPETRFPGPLHDAVSCYLRLVEDLGIPPENIIIAGDSAGGGLSLAVLMYLRDNSYPLPSGGVLMSPWVDLTMSCDSWDSNAPFDVVPIPAPDDHLNPVAIYLGDNMERYLTHPYVSPLFGDFKGLPPLLIQAGEAEVLRDEITLLAHKATLAGVEVRHELYEDAIHVFHSYPFLDAAHRAFISCRDFVQNILPRVQSRSPRVLDGTAEAVLEHEIDNENVRVVRGDGVETASGLQEIKHELEIGEEDQGEGEQGEEDEEAEDSESESEDEEDVRQAGALKDGAFPSWGRTSPWPSSPLMSDDGDLDWAAAAAETRGPTTPCASTQEVQSLPAMRRIQSALSILMPEPPSVSPRSTATTWQGTRRTRRNTVTYPRRMNHHHHHHIVIPPILSMSSVSTKTPPPSPSIRRSSASHPDITSLVQQWANTGPANQTVMYKPQAS